MQLGVLAFIRFAKAEKATLKKTQINGFGTSGNGQNMGDNGGTYGTDVVRISQ